MAAYSEYLRQGEIVHEKAANAHLCSRIEKSRHRAQDKRPMSKDILHRKSCGRWRRSQAYLRKSRKDGDCCQNNQYASEKEIGAAYRTHCFVAVSRSATRECVRRHQCIHEESAIRRRKGAIKVPRELKPKARLNRAERVLRFPEKGDIRGTGRLQDRDAGTEDNECAEKPTESPSVRSRQKEQCARSPSAEGQSPSPIYIPGDLPLLLPAVANTKHEEKKVMGINTAPAYVRTKAALKWGTKISLSAVRNPQRKNRINMRRKAADSLNVLPSKRTHSPLLPAFIHVENLA